MMGLQPNFNFLTSLIIVTLFFGTFNCNDNSNDPANRYDKSVTDFSEIGQGLPYFIGEDMQVIWNLDAVPEESIRKISVFKAINQANQKISNKNILGKISIVSFFFTRCSGICPMLMQNLKQVQKEFYNNSKIMMYSFSATPDLDSVKVLKDYAAKRSIDAKRWMLLTGDKNIIYDMARNSFNADTITSYEKANGRNLNDFLHSESVFLLDKENHLRGVYQGKNLLSLQDLISDIRLLIQE